MTDLNILIKRCEEIIEEGNGISNLQHGKSQSTRINTSIENIYNFCFPNGIPTHLTLSNLLNTLKNQGISLRTLSEIGIFRLRLSIFKGFVEDLKKGLITRDLISLLSVDIYNIL